MEMLQVSVWEDAGKPRLESYLGHCRMLRTGVVWAHAGCCTFLQFQVDVDRISVAYINP